MAKVTGATQENLPKVKKEQQIALPGCTREGVLYVLDYQACRKEGIRRQYIGESSRSGYQRGREHWKEVSEGALTHPMTLHFLEEHEGKQQEVILRIVNKFHTALARQVAESVLIEEVANKPEECLNLKSEWGGSKLPGVTVSKPKGTSRRDREVPEGTKRGRMTETQTIETQPATEGEPPRPRKTVRRGEINSNRKEEQENMSGSGQETEATSGRGQSGTGVPNMSDVLNTSCVCNMSGGRQVDTSGGGQETEGKQVDT